MITYLLAWLLTYSVRSSLQSGTDGYNDPSALQWVMPRLHQYTCCWLKVVSSCIHLSPSTCILYRRQNNNYVTEIQSTCIPDEQLVSGDMNPYTDTNCSSEIRVSGRHGVSWCKRGIRGKFTSQSCWLDRIVRFSSRLSPRFIGYSKNSSFWLARLDWTLVGTKNLYKLHSRQNLF